MFDNSFTWVLNYSFGSSFTYKFQLTAYRETSSGK